MGRWSAEDPEEPVAWTNTYRGGRMFYTTLGHPGDFQNEAFRRMLVNAVRWSLDRD
jgi:type 1 glutamine amidotransferase